MALKRRSDLKVIGGAVGVKSSGKRSIQVQDRKYVWYVASDDEAHVPGMALNIVSEDKKFIVRYHLQQNSGERHLTVLGKEFGAIDVGGTWRRFLCPDFSDGVRVTPRHVRALIEWSREADAQLIEVDYRGNPIGDALGS